MNLSKALAAELSCIMPGEGYHAPDAPRADDGPPVARPVPHEVVKPLRRQKTAKRAKSTNAKQVSDETVAEILKALRAHGAPIFARELARLQGRISRTATYHALAVLKERGEAKCEARHDLPGVPTAWEAT